MYTNYRLGRESLGLTCGTILSRIVVAGAGDQTQVLSSVIEGAFSVPWVSKGSGSVIRQAAQTASKTRLGCI